MEEKLVFYPSPGIGHLISMVELGKLLLSQNPSLSITILIPNFPFNTGSTSSYISSVSSAFPSISFHSFPPISLHLDNNPSNYPDMESITYETLSNNCPNVLNFLKSLSLSSPVSAFVIDFFCYRALDVGSSLNIPTYFFITSGVASLALSIHCRYFDKIAPNGFRNLRISYDIPGLISVPANHVMESLLDRSPLSFDEFVKMGAQLTKANGIIVNSFESLEPRAVEALKQGTCLPGVPIPPIYCVGPLIANRGDGDDGGRREKEGDGVERHECLRWLDSQPSRSVVYLGFGSRGMFSKEQLGEIALGLKRSGVRFLWVVRAPPNEDKAKKFMPPPEPDLDSLLPNGFLDRTRDRGLVMKSWVPQIAILRHGSVGGFVTHCGWNSTLEAVCEGVPLVAWPLYAEQRFNKIWLVDEVKIALPMDESDDRFVSSDEIEKRVRQIICSEEGDVVRKRVLELSHEAKVAFSKGGSSKAALAAFMESWKR